MVAGALQLAFDDFVLDEANARLSRSGRPVPLPPKALAVLCALTRQAGQLARKDDLLDAVWGHRHVSDSVLKTTINQVRAALADSAGEPRYVETVPRHGYRFVAALRRLAEPAPLPPPSDAAPAVQPISLIAREATLARLRTQWTAVSRGQRALVWIEGDAGIGKTTLIDRFAAEVAAGRSAHGQCVEQFGTGEPYLPLIEALEGLARHTPEVVATMRQVAPTWLVQMPWYLSEADRATLQAELSGAGQERMVRELWELMERLTRDGPMLLVTEDLHWSDPGTLRLMDHFARRRTPLRLLWLASFRLAQMVAEQHPLQGLRQELRLHRLVDEVVLEAFSEVEVAAYVEGRVPDQGVSPEFVRALHAHTDGLPLFVANVVDTLLAAGSLGAAGRGIGPAANALPVPESLAGAVERQLARLAPPTRAVLEAASVCGMEFRAGTVAELVGQPVEAVIETCDALVRHQYWLGEAGVVVGGAGELDARYVFQHAVYRHVLAQRLAVAQRAAYHRRAARALARGNGSSAEIASHHELGLEFRDAARYYDAAATGALGRYAAQEALQLTERALTLLPHCPEGAERQELELSLVATRGIALGTLNGIAAPETVAAFQRVTALCDALPPSPQRALLLNSAGWGMLVRADYAGAIAMVRRMQTVAEQFDDEALHVFGLNLLGVCLANSGRHAEACEALHAGLALCERDSDPVGGSRLYVDAQTSMYSNIAPPMMQLGLFDQARAMAARAVQRTRQFGQPMARLVAHWCNCIVATRLGDVASTELHAAELERLAAQVQQAAGPARWYRGWIEIRHGRLEAGHALVREGFDLYERFGTVAGCSETRAFATDALVQMQRWDEAQATIDEANGIVERHAERLFVPELRLLQARIDAGRGDGAARRHSIESAIAEASSAGALGSELQACVALAELPDRAAADLERLRHAHSRITEGFDTPAYRRAAGLLGA